ncbi:MAG: hypothetical protein ACLQIB_47395 [Isosphaeraceae bacterium]
MVKSATIRSALAILVAGVMGAICSLAASVSARSGPPEPSQTGREANRTSTPDQCKQPGPKGSAEANAGQSSPDDELDALFREYSDVVTSRMNAIREANRAKKAIPPKNKDNDARLIVRRVLEIATNQPRTATAEKALIWLAGTSSVNLLPEAETALTILARDHAASDRLKDILYPESTLFWWSSAAEALARRAMVASPSPEIRGRAAFQLAHLLEVRSRQGRSDPIQAQRRPR